jgi:hypothetical protein
VWKRTGDAFNVGDLASHLIDDDLRRLLESEGVRDLRIDLPDLSELWWLYEAALVDGNEVTAAIQEVDGNGME